LPKRARLATAPVGILDSLEARNRQALKSKLAYTEFLAILIEDEVARREQKKFALRLRRAAFRASKALDQLTSSACRNSTAPWSTNSLPAATSTSTSRC